MSLINFILDIAALLLWLSWRSIPFDPLTRATPATLAGTVRRAEPARWKRWHFLAVLAGLLFFRSLFYWQIGAAIKWTPRLDLGIVALAFRSDLFLPSLLFSLLSFARAWIVFHFWLLALVMIHGRPVETNPFHKLVFLQLGWAARWPRWGQALLPLVFTIAVWLLVHPLLVRAEVVKLASSMPRVIQQGALLGGVVYLTLKNVIVGFLFLHLVASYVYLGTSPIWDYVSTTSRKVLLPLERLPLRLGKVDFAPLLGMVLVLLLLQTLPDLILNQLNQRNLTLWPQ